MKNNMKLVNDEFIKGWEQLRLKAYLPTPNDRPTIGWGRAYGVKMGDTITLSTAKRMFREDVSNSEGTVNRLVKVRLTQNQFDALVSFVHNLGAGNFASSTLLRRLNEGKYEEASAQFGRWIHQGKKVLRGLVRRRAAEAELFLSPSGTLPLPIAHETVVAPSTESLKGLNKSVEVIGGTITAFGAAVGVANNQLDVLPDYAQSAVLLTIVVAGAYLVYNRLVARKDGVR